MSNAWGHKNDGNIFLWFNSSFRCFFVALFTCGYRFCIFTIPVSLSTIHPSFKAVKLCNCLAYSNKELNFSEAFITTHISTLRRHIVLMGQLLPLFVYFCSFQKQFYRKKCRANWVSNSDHQSRRRACWPLGQHHGPRRQIACSFNTNLVLFFY